MISSHYIETFTKIKPIVQHYLNSLEAIESIIKINGGSNSLYYSILKPYISQYEIQFLYYHITFMPEDDKQRAILACMAEKTMMFDNFEQHKRKTSIRVSFHTKK